MGEVHSISARAHRPHGGQSPGVPAALALGLALAAAALPSPGRAQETLADTPGDADESANSAAATQARPAATPARPAIPARPARAQPEAPPAGFSAAFAPFAGTAPPDLDVPESAVDLATIEPEIETPAFRRLGTGTASYYGRRFHGRRTANGERFDMNALTAAHRTLPFGSIVRVTNPANGRSVTVRINDRGPFISGRVIDLSRAAARRIGMIRRGHAPVEIELLE